MNSFVRRYRKFIIAAAAGVAVLATALADGKVDGTEIYQIVAAVLGALGVAVIPNAPKQGSNTTRVERLPKM